MEFTLRFGAHGTVTTHADTEQEAREQVEAVVVEALERYNLATNVSVSVGRSQRDE